MADRIPQRSSLFSTRPINALVVVQPSVSHYREPMMKMLRSKPELCVTFAGKYDSPEGLADPRESVAAASDDTLNSVIQLRVRRLFGPFTWEQGLFIQVLRRRYDVVILEGRIFTLSTWVLLILHQILRRPTLLWGHGWRRAEGGIKRRVRLAFYQLSSGLMVYGDRARRIGIDAGFPSNRIRVVGNSICDRHDIERQVAERKIYRAHRADERLTVLCIGRLSPRRRVEVLLDAAAELRCSGHQIRLMVVGDGSSRPELERMAVRQKLDVDFVGPIYDSRRLAEVFDQADVTVIPGAAGLSIVQSFGFGCPVIIHDDDRVHGPESELLVPGHNGLTFREGSAPSLAQRILEVGSWRQVGSDEVARLCMETVLTSYSAEAHAEAIVQSIRVAVLGNWGAEEV